MIVRHTCAGKNFFVPIHFFGSTNTTSRFGERFRDCQYSLISFLFAVLLLAVPPAQPFVKVEGGSRDPVSYEVGATVRSCRLDL